ncbi:bifunctional folylpolyglutamate synthase/dihydrofolate synthase [Candidatus Bipolaricaulota bacterium]|nr:bifunctional folylpolyglutamate synthase/dihydrofolate synthase [Candidatus Bipolaricaulota bacterium]
MTKNPEKAFELLHSLPKYDVQPGLERIEYLLDKLENPDRNYRSIHVAGSNGKGSVVAMLSGVTGQNYRVGEFLSPPLRGFSDRIIVDGNPIDKASIIEGLGELAEPIRRLRERDNEPSFFEASTALAAWYFDREKVDLALLEAGLGGRYDATNPVGEPVLSAVTSVDLEHQNILGDSIEEIARELAGIAKKNRPLVVGPSKNLPERIFREECRDKGCKLVRAEEKTEVRIRDFDWHGSRFEVQKAPIRGLESETLETGLAGTYQERNLRTALTILGEFLDTEFSPEPGQIKTGLKNADWPGRFQLLEENPHLLVDGAHNEAAASLLAEELKRYLPLRPREARIKLVFSGLKDKDIKGMLSALNPVVDEIYLTELDLPRAVPLVALERWANQIGLSYNAVRSPAKAIRIAKKDAKMEDLICVTGSLYLVREAIGSES